MKIDLPNVCNVRDLGGIVTKYGKIKSGRLIRAGVLNRLKDGDEKIFKEHRLKRVVDFRTPMEMENNPDVIIDGVKYLNIPIVRSVTFGISFESLDGPTMATRLQAGYERMRAQGEEYPDHMDKVYRRYVKDEFCRNAYGTFLKMLANDPVDGATLWHCTMGKDRVGTSTALLEYCLGVDIESIYADYMDTNEQTRNNTNSVLNTAKPYVAANRMDLIKAMLMVRTEYLDAFFDEMKVTFGSVENFIKACGVTDGEIEKLRSNYLD